MTKLAKATIQWLETFVARVYVELQDEDLSPFGESAMKSLSFLFAFHGLQLVEPTRGKGAASIAHNEGADKYVYCTLPGCSAPIVLKPRFKCAGRKRVALYGYHASIDPKQIATDDDLLAFWRAFDPKKVSKTTLDKAILSHAARQASEDVGNNFARRTELKWQTAEQDARRVAGFVGLSDAAWDETQGAMLQSGDESLVALVDAVNEARFAAASATEG